MNRVVKALGLMTVACSSVQGLLGIGGSGNDLAAICTKVDSVTGLDIGSLTGTWNIQSIDNIGSLVGVGDCAKVNIEKGLFELIGVTLLGLDLSLLGGLASELGVPSTLSSSFDPAGCVDGVIPLDDLVFGSLSNADLGGLLATLNVLALEEDSFAILSLC